MLTMKSRSLIISLVVVCSVRVPIAAQNAPWFERSRVIDLTGDGVPDTLRVTAKGRSWKDISAAFTIRSAGQVLYEHTWDGRDHFMHASETGSDAAMKTALNDILWGPHVRVLDGEILCRDMVVADLSEHADTVAADLVIRELLEARRLSLNFTPGDGETNRVLAWSARLDRFVLVAGCCGSC
jgi:hypothetical protein